MTLDITATDIFCGAGGSCTGLVAAGVRAQTAINHWQRAIDTHSANHPTTNHDCMDVRLVRPSEYPRTTIGWFSPECTSHSLAKGARRKAVNQMDLWGNTPHFDPAEERSRATMREVVEWSECHRYEIVIVENVVDIRYWEFYEDWIQAMTNLGYEHRALYFNAQFFGVPQSRDRVYFVFWKRGNRSPDLEFRPAAICPKHGQIEAHQAFKKPDYRWGRYGKKRQYTYVCPLCGAHVEPATVPAWTVIDWSIQSTLIGERKNPLKPKTTARIRAGLEKYAGTWMLVDTVNPGDGGRVRSVDDPMGTQTSRQSYALVSPFMLSYMNNETPARGVNDSMYTIAGSHTPPLITPPAFLLQYYGRNDAQSRVDDALPTITGDPRHALVSLPFITEYYGQTEVGHPVDVPLSTVTSLHKHGLVTPPFFISPGGVCARVGASAAPSNETR